jgi:putative CocE/NonD family hydrolase
MTQSFRHVRRAILLALVAFLPISQTPAQAAPARAAADSSRAYEKTEVMIPMRDGVRLHTMILVPKVIAEDLPIIMVRTPYGIAGGERSLNGNLLAQEGYIFAFQDLRGRYTSEGQFEMLRPMRDKRDPKAIDESTDAYDTVEWLLKNVPHNNGRVGMKGVSYPGWTTVMAMLDPHPALKAVSPQASPADMFIGDDFHHGGAFRLSYAFEYATLMESNKERGDFTFDDPDTYSWYLKLGSLAHVNEKYLHGTIPSWNNFATHPNWDAFWQRQAVAPYVDRPRVPTLNVAGWWDQEDFYGPIKIYELLEKRDSANLNYLVVGPWNHGGWGGATGQKLGPIDFGSPTARDFRMNIEAPWFAYWLKGKGALKLAEATTFEVGTNAWQNRASWPLKTNVAARRLYFHPMGRLSFDPPATPSDSGFDAYVSDPANPVPYRARPVHTLFTSGSTWSRWLMDDQRFLKGRMDVVNWEMAPLKEDVVLAGNVIAHLFASTSGSDADWVVKLIDVYPETEPDSTLRGYELMVANDVLRGRFRKSYEKPEAIVPNKVDEYSIDLHTQDYRFKKGHKIKVQVQSSWFPLIDRNPQTFVPNIFEARDSDFKAATMKVFRTRSAASYVQIDVLGGEPIRP